METDSSFDDEKLQRAIEKASLASSTVAGVCIGFSSLLTLTKVTMGSIMAAMFIGAFVWLIAVPINKTFLKQFAKFLGNRDRLKNCASKFYILMPLGFAYGLLALLFVILMVLVIAFFLSFPAFILEKL